jgi:hypothetical protein
VTWSAFLQAVRVRAVEETDADGKVWDAESRRAVTREAGQGNARTEDFLDRRSVSLANKGSYPSIAPLLRVPHVPGWIAAAGWIAAFAIGWWLTALGQEREINLLALPLIGILAWNAVMVLLSLWPGSRTQKRDPHAHDDDWRAGLLKRLEKKHALAPGADPLAAGALSRFQELAHAVTLRRFSFRLKAWFHIGAALLALGSISAMYARGWSKEYRAVWESTLLDDKGAERFFGALFAPASIVTGQAIPLDEVPGMQRGSDGKIKVKAGDALPWIHLYAATLALFVLVPRALLTLLELSRAKAVPARALQESDWQQYVQRLRSLVEGAGAPALVLTHGLSHDTAARDRWRHWAFLHWRDVGQLAFDQVPVGGESEFVNAWLPPASRIMLIFNMATTPEVEVQRALVDSILHKMRSENGGPGTPLLLALDDADLRKRWSGFADLSPRLAERSTAWSDAMDGTGAIWHEVVMPSKHAK